LKKRYILWYKNFKLDFFRGLIAFGIIIANRISNRKIIGGIDMSNFVFAGKDTVELAKKYGTPLYVMSGDMINDKCDEINESFLNKYDNTMAVYASKAFLNLAMVKMVAKKGIGLDVVSGGELYTAHKAGINLENVMFHGNNKTASEIAMGIDLGVGRFVVDNRWEMYLINELAQEKGKKVKILFRITPGVKSDTHDYISTGQKDSKFGIPIVEDVIVDVVDEAMKLSNIKLMGLHFHVGSQLHDNSSHLRALDATFGILDKLYDKFTFVPKELNVGGGFGIYYNKEDDVKPLSYFVDPIMEKISGYFEKNGLDRAKVIIEPGRWIAGEAGITLYKLTGKKEIPGIHRYISVDGGLPDNPRPALYGAEYEAVVANKYGQEAAETITIAGKCCETGDILIKNIQLPITENGDYLAVMSTGAYNYSMASHYNRIPKAAVLMITEGREDIIVERETYEDVISQDRVPSWLE
jgi:diaminopimelate decarboxylase